MRARVVRLQPIKNLRQHCLSFKQRLQIGESQHVKTKLLQCLRATSIHLHQVGLEVLTTVEFND